MRLRVSLAIAVCAVLATSAAAAPPAPVGGPPTQDFHRCFRQIAPCGDPVVIGSTASRFGAIEVVALTSAEGLCVDVDVVGSGSGGSCPEEPPREEIAITGTSNAFGERRDTYTQLEGTADPAVATVTARYVHRGKWHTVTGLVARIEGDLQTTLEQRRPFSFFVVTVAGCVESHRFRVTARDPSGAVLQRARGIDFTGISSPCDSEATVGNQWTGLSRAGGALRSAAAGPAAPAASRDSAGRLAAPGPDAAAPVAPDRGSGSAGFRAIRTSSSFPSAFASRLTR